MSEQPTTPLHTLLVRTAAVLEDLADDVRERRATDHQLTEMADLLDEVSAALRDHSATYVPPRVVDGREER
ncbi:hypothetical protein GCM10011581_46200 [Saccharopolyspora subtropica]|uniref:Uncharacterized protein n=1 Tax=Saccharopolyspora thermophila TaxID=89367 RepID=A0A917K8L2_9PSEU|nr:hypothetical protein [Saccharopolyspora subtropica]GGJ03952.1 hypothetical protein GCM10011581_46200 [Saccharopolyspora subtropica]